MIWMLTTALAGPWVPQPEGRYLVANEVLLPRAVWFNDLEGRFGFETRSWQARAVLGCTATAGKRDRREVVCTVEDVALQASAFQRTPDDDPAQTVAVLEAFEGHLRGSSLHLTLTERGRRTRWHVEGEPEGSLRHTDIGRLVGLILERSAVALVSERPRDTLEVGGQWVASGPALMSYPLEEGAMPLGSAQLLHQVSALGDRVVIDAAGEGAMLDPVSNEQLRSVLRARSVWSATGAVRERTWSLEASVLDVVTYHHAGWLRRLGADAPVPELGPTRQVRGPGVAEGDDLAGLPAWPELR